jgi:hypothetical protein
MSSYLGFNLNPAPTGGQGAYGAVSGQVGAPPSIYQQIQSVAPGVDNLTASSVGDIQNQLNGVLSPSTMMNIGNYAAARGVSMGQPNSPLSNLIGMNVTGTTTEQLQQAGQSNYLNFLSGVGNTQLNPALLTDIAQSNANLAAAPDPQAAAQELERLIMQQRGPQGGSSWNSSPAGGTRSGGGGSSYNSNPYSGMGFLSQDGGNLNYGTNATNPFKTGIGPVISTGGGGDGFDWMSILNDLQSPQGGGSQSSQGGGSQSSGSGAMDYGGGGYGSSISGFGMDWTKVNNDMLNTEMDNYMSDLGITY